MISTEPTCDDAPEATSSTVTAEGALTNEFIAALRDGYQMGDADRARHNAVANNDIKSLALNRGVLRGDDGHFSHRVRSKGVTNQQNSGRCWMFAGLNVLRPQVIRDHRMEEFEFSTAYLQFWDKMEKANVYLESIIELRDASFLDRDWELVNKQALEDGGWWNYLVGLVEKYGVMPLSAMPETHASAHTVTFNEILGRLLRSRAVRILDRYADGIQIDELRAQKNAVLAEVYRLLVIHFGEPPAEFEWRYPVKKSGESESPGEDDLQSAENRQLTPPERHTPQSFYRQYVGRPLSEFVCLYNDPHNELGRHYSFDRARNIVGNECMHFVNVATPSMKEIAQKSILANEPVWFAVNMDFDQSSELGLMKHRLFDYETLFDIDMGITKANRTRFHSGASSHAMALMGVDLDAAGQPRKWLVENSWGDDKGDKGLWTLHDDWFDEHVYTIIVHRRHVPADILEQFNQDPTVLPAWYPGSQCVSSAPNLA
jgi:bleomycin hydrolase